MSSPLVPAAATNAVYQHADTCGQASDWILGSRCPEIQRSLRLRHRRGKGRLRCELPGDTWVASLTHASIPAWVTCSGSLAQDLPRP